MVQFRSSFLLLCDTAWLVPQIRRYWQFIFKGRNVSEGIHFIQFMWNSTLKVDTTRSSRNIGYSTDHPVKQSHIPAERRRLPQNGSAFHLYISTPWIFCWKYCIKESEEHKLRQQMPVLLSHSDLKGLTYFKHKIQGNDKRLRSDKVGLSFVCACVTTINKSHIQSI